MKRGGGGVILTALGLAAVLAALSFVTWRQSRAREVLAEMDRVHREISLVQAERAELERRIQTLESRGHVVPTARERLGLVTPDAAEIVLLVPGAGDEVLARTREESSREGGREATALARGGRP
jgi:cell division protein FtsL